MLRLSVGSPVQLSERRKIQVGQRVKHSSENNLKSQSWDETPLERAQRLCRPGCCRHRLWSYWPLLINPCHSGLFWWPNALKLLWPGSKGLRVCAVKKGLSHQTFLRLCIRHLTKDSRSGRNYKSESVRYSVAPAPAVIKPLFMHNINLSLLMYIRWFKFPLLPLMAWKKLKQAARTFLLNNKHLPYYFSGTCLWVPCANLTLGNPQLLHFIGSMRLRWLLVPALLNAVLVHKYSTTDAQTCK